MARSAGRMFLAYVIVACAAGNCPAAPVQLLGDLRAAAIVISDHSLDTFFKVRSIAENAGARCLQMFPPDAIFGLFPASLKSSGFEGLSVELCVARGELAGKGLDPLVQRVLGDLLNRKELLASSPAVEEAPIEDRLLRVPEDVIRATTPSGPRRGAPKEIQDRGINQNSEFLIGSVLINLIFPESDGGDENWTDEELSDAVAAVSLGLSEYQQQALWVNLSFTLNYKTFLRVPVSIEPIEGDMYTTDNIWIAEALDTLGFRRDIFTGAHALNTRARGSFNTDWVLTAFVVNMSNHYTADPPSPDPGCWGGAGYVAYAYLGGPFLVVPYPACRYGYGLGFGQVFIHEMSHIFWALDEYVSEGPAGPTGTPCSAISGYLAVPNRNTLFNPCQTTVPCIMQSGRKSSPLPICDYTMGQVGLADANDNSIPDIYEISPIVEFQTRPGISMDTIFSGDDCYLSTKMRNEAIHNRNPQQDSGHRINYAPTLAGGEISINEEPFASFAPLDGKWDASQEEKVFTMTDLQPGANTITVRVKNCVDMKAYAQTKIFFIGLKYYFVSLEAADKSIRVSWTTSGEVFGAAFDVMRSDITTGEHDRLVGTVSIPDETGKRRAYSFTDGEIMPDHEYHYRIVGRFSINFRGEQYAMEFPSREVAQTSIIPVTGLVSYLLPNPTSNHTSFTVNVPKSWRDMSGSGEPPLGGEVHKAPLSMEIRTSVDVSVYDVLGRKTKTIYSNSRYGGLLTLSWDGTNEAGTLVPSGVYFVSVRAGDKKDVKKVVLIR